MTPPRGSSTWGHAASWFFGNPDRGSGRRLFGSSAVAAPRVVLLEMAGGARDVRQEVRASAEQALRELGVEVVPQSQVKTSLDDCNVPSCLAELGRQAGASHILEIQGSYVNESYNLRLDLRDGETGRILGSDAKECEICSARDFYRAVKDCSAALWTRVVREQGSAESVPSPAVATTPARTELTEAKPAPPPARSAGLSGGSRCLCSGWA